MLRTVIGGLLFIGLLFSNSEGIRLLPFATEVTATTVDCDALDISGASATLKSNYNFSVRDLSSKRPRAAEKNTDDSTEHSTVGTASTAYLSEPRQLITFVPSFNFYQKPAVEAAAIRSPISGRAPPSPLV